MRTNDELLLEKIYTEGFLDRTEARLKTIGGKVRQNVYGGLGKVAGNTKGGAVLRQAADAEKMGVDEERASILIANIKKNLENDAKKLGIDLTKIASTVGAHPNMYPKLEGISKILWAINNANAPKKGGKKPAPKKGGKP